MNIKKYNKFVKESAEEIYQDLDETDIEILLEKYISNFEFVDEYNDISDYVDEKIDELLDNIDDDLYSTKLRYILPYIITDEDMLKSIYIEENLTNIIMFGYYVFELPENDNFEFLMYLEKEDYELLKLMPVVNLWGEEIEINVEK